MATSRSQVVVVDVCVACSKEYVVAILCGCKDSMNSENAFEFYDFKYLKKKNYLNVFHNLSLLESKWKLCTQKNMIFYFLRMGQPQVMLLCTAKVFSFACNRVFVVLFLSTFCPLLAVNALELRVLQVLNGVGTIAQVYVKVYRGTNTHSHF